VTLAAYRAKHVKSTAEYAWQLTLFSSLLLAIGGVDHAIALWRGVTTDKQPISSILLADNNASLATTVSFLAFCMADLGVGLLAYRAHIHPITGWAHHIGYILMLSYFLRNRMTMSFAVFAICELPTFLLALQKTLLYRGAAGPKARKLLDWLFGLTFFALRILYFAWIMVHVVADHHFNTIQKLLCVGIFSMHAHWMLEWCKKRLFPKTGSRAVGGNAVTATALGPKDGGSRNHHHHHHYVHLHLKAE
jgi:hypothetical protein